MRHAVLIVAAGRGLRAGPGGPKQYRNIGGVPMLVHTLRAVLDVPEVDAVRVVIRPDDAESYDRVSALIEDGRMLPPVHGGDTRRQSVRNGLLSLAPEQPAFVHVHDAARPMVSPAIFTAVMGALETHDGAFPALPVVDALWSGADMTSVPRDGLLRAQTPQSFRFDRIVEAHGSASGDEADDVAVARAAGLDVVPVPGEEANFKVTTSADMERAERALRALPDIRVGTGFDVHAFEDGDHVTLCGIRVAHDRALKGHSDADVAMHAMTDALYGALAEGDIGQWFPPSEAEWKGAASEIFLRHAVGRVAENGFRIGNIDCTIICEAPKIGPHAQAMREEISRITGLEVARISVKATTSERLGFTGRREGIAAQASAVLVRP